MAAYSTREQQRGLKFEIDFFFCLVFKEQQGVQCCEKGFAPFLVFFCCCIFIIKIQNHKIRYDSNHHTDVNITQT